MGKNVIISTLPNISQNYLSKLSTGNIFVDSLVYDNGTSVMINTATAHADYASARLIVNNTGNAYLEVRGNGGQGTIALTTSTSTTSNFPTVEIFNSADFGIVAYRPGVVSSNYLMYYELSSSTNRRLTFQTEGVTRLGIQGAGRILMGPTLPTDDGSTALQVNGGGKFSSSISATSATFSNQVIATSNANTYAGGSLILKAVGSVNPIYLTSVVGNFALSNGGGTDHLLIASTGAATFSNTTSGNALRLSTSYASGRALNFGFSDGSVLPTAAFYIGNQTGVGVFIGDETTTNGLYVKSNGNVGIGTNSPSEALHVYSSVTSPRPALFLETASASGTPEVRLFQTSGRAILMNLQTNGDWSFQNSTNNSTYNPRMTITSGGNVLIGTTSETFDTGTGMRIDRSGQATIRLVGQSSGGEWTMGSSGMQFDARVGYIRFITGANSGTAVERMLISSTGTVFIYSVYSQTSASAANVIVGSDGNLFRSTSSLKYKKDVVNYTKGLAEVMKLRPVTYKGKNEIDGNRQFAGLIAEEIHDLGLTEFVQYADDGTPDALAYQNMVALLTKAIQELKAQIEEQKADIESLKTLINK